MKYLLFFLFPLLLIASCKKEKTPEVAVQYNIYVNDWNPDIVSNGDYITLNIDGSGQSEFEFWTNTHTQWYDSSGYDIYFNALVKVLQQVDTNFKIAIYSDTLNANLFAINNMINPSAKWVGGVELYEKRWWDHSNSNSNVEYYYNPFEINNGNGYLAIKREMNGDTYYGWVHVNVQHDQVTFYESGFNNIPNVPIRIGQTE